VDTLHDLFLKTRSTGPQAARFDNGRMIPVVTEVLRFAHERALERQRTRTLDGWLRRELLGHLDDAVVSDELPALLDLLHVVRDDPELSDMLVELRDQLMAEDQGFPELLAVLGDTLQSAKDARLAVPALRFVGRELAPDKDLMFEAASMMQRSLEADPRRADAGDRAARARDAPPRWPVPLGPGAGPQADAPPQPAGHRPAGRRGHAPHRGRAGPLPGGR
jgi:hypothetical protein